MNMWEAHQMQLTIIDKQIEGLLEKICADKPVLEITSKPKPIRHHAPVVNNLHGMLVTIYGINASSISGINDYTLLRLLGETGINMNRFPTKKKFVSWCGLAPKHHQSGKMNKRVKGTSCNNAGQIFKEIAQGLINSKYIAIGK